MVAPIGFRNDIVFLRCIAIIAVVLYHLRVPYFNDGYVGVDIFFVVSGYLMTKIIVQGLDRGTFNVLDFYKRRLLRIYPALLVLLLFFFIVLYVVLAVKLYDYSRFALSSSLFVSNLYYYLSSGYFQPASKSISVAYLVVIRRMAILFALSVRSFSFSCQSTETAEPNLCANGTFFLCDVVFPLRQYLVCILYVSYKGLGVICRWNRIYA